MKKNTIKIICIVCLVCVLAVILLERMYSGGVFVTDRSAEFDGNVLHWNGDTYILPAEEWSEAAWSLDRPLAKTTDGYGIYEIKGYPEHEYVCVTRFLAHYILERQD